MQKRNQNWNCSSTAGCLQRGGNLNRPFLNTFPFSILLEKLRPSSDKLLLFRFFFFFFFVVCVLCLIHSNFSDAIAMSVAFDGSRRLGSSGSSRGGASYGSSIFQMAGDDRVVGDGGGEVLARKEGDDLNACTSSSSASSSSSIGRNSDLSGRSSDGEGGGENEVQSAYKGPLDAMESLEEVLPMRRGISSFYSGKSKSFTSLAEAATTASVKEIVKPENAYTRKRRSHLALNLLWDKNRNNNSGISKRPITSSRSLLAMAVAISSSESNGSEDSNASSSSRSPPRRPPLHPRARISIPCLAPSSSPHQTFSGWRSYSLADLHQCSTSKSINVDQN